MFRPPGRLANQGAGPACCLPPGFGPRV